MSEKKGVCMGFSSPQYSLLIHAYQVQCSLMTHEEYHHETGYGGPLSIGVIGLGYVGLPLSILSAERGFRTVGFDVDRAKIRSLTQDRTAVFLKAHEREALGRLRCITFTDSEKDLEQLDVYLVAVPTPVSRSHLPDLGPLLSAAKTVGRHLHPGALIVIESTVNPGVCEEAVLPVLERESGLSRDVFSYAHCPERVNPGDARWDVRSIPRVVGGRDAVSRMRAAQLYRSLIDAPVLEMGSIPEAEAVKMVENSFRDVNIAFVNELAIAFDRAGIDLMRVLDGASTKPFGFMPHRPGCGVGGHCIPVDPYYLIHYGAEHGFVHRFLLAAREVNEHMPVYAVEVLEAELARHDMLVSGSTIALLGLSYKKDIPDTRESPALRIRYLLQQKGAQVRCFDPFVSDAGSAASLEEALLDADAVCIATDHTVFQELTPNDFSAAGVSVVVDGRNCLQKEAFEKSGVTYRGIGRGGSSQAKKEMLFNARRPKFADV